MPKTIMGKELNANIDRLVTEQRQLIRKFKSLEDASCEKASEAEAFYTLIAARFQKVADEDEKQTYGKVFARSTVSEEAAATAAERVSINDVEVPDEQAANEVGE